MLRYQAHAVPGIIECKNATLQLPLAFDPGDRWDYGINIDWVGKTVERLSGQSLEDYFREHIFDPLGMLDTGFVVGADQRTRLAGMHVRQADGSLQAIPFEVPQAPEFFMGGGGLYSTGPDYLSFLRMLLGDGQLGEARVLRPETVAEMGKNQIGELTVGLLKTSVPGSSNDAEFFPGMVKKWGLGYMISTEEAPTGRSAGSLAWAGLANTYYWIDPTRRITGVILTQILPFADATVLNLFEQLRARHLRTEVGHGTETGREPSCVPLRCTVRGSPAGPPPPVAAPLASSLRAPFRGDPPLKNLLTGTPICVGQSRTPDDFGGGHWASRTPDPAPSPSGGWAYA